MTIAIRPQSAPYTAARNIAGRAGTTAEVWDIPAATASKPAVGASSSVRALAGPPRTGERLSATGAGFAADHSQGFEPSRENRDNLILGTVLSAALLIGSAFGGVFSGSEGAAPVSEPSAHIVSAQPR